MKNSLVEKCSIGSKLGKWYIILIGVFAFLYPISNVLEPKVFAGSFCGFEYYITGGIIFYPILFLITDIIGEIWGKKASDLAVRIGLVSQLTILGATQLMLHLPGNEWLCGDGAYASVFGTTGRFAAASIVAFFISQSWDVWIFAKIRSWYIKKNGSTAGGRWIWNNGSTMTSQIIDTVIYTIISLGFAPEAWTCCLSTIAIKWLIAWADTPFFYGITNHLNKLRQKEYPELGELGAE